MSADPTLWTLLPLLMLAGAAAGFASGLFGIGGGFVVVPVLLLILPQMGTAADSLVHVAVGTSLATIIFTSLRSARAHARRGALDLDMLRGWAPWIVVGTVLGSQLADQLSSDALALVFAVGVLVFSAHFLLPVFANRQLADTLPSGALRAVIASALGMLSTLLGIGGGVIATVTMTLCGTPMHRAIGTASGVGAIVAVPAATGFLMTGLDESGLPWGSLGYVNLPCAVAVVSASMLLAPAGVALAHRLSPKLLRSLFGSYLLLVGITMLTQP